MLKVKFAHTDAVLPTLGSDGAAGYDLSSVEDTVVPARGRKIVDTGIQVAFPSGHYMRIAPRSGLAAKHGIDVFAGVIDFDYRGVVKVILMNNEDVDFVVKKGDRIAQAILEKISVLPVVLEESLDDTNRGVQGFGSTGV